jgi:hypothetical protein
MSIEWNRQRKDASRTPAMSGGHGLLSRGASAPELCENRPPRGRGRPSREGAGATLKGGRGECRVPCAPAASCAKVESTRVSHHRFTGTPGIPCAMVLTVSFELSPVTGLSCHCHPCNAARIITSLTPASGRQDHTTSPSASRRSRQQHRSRPSHPAPNVRDDRDTSLSGGTRRRGVLK